jgi:addiction module HigA family antidote
MRIHDPLHPGEVLFEAYIEPTGLSLNDVAQHLDVPLEELEEVLDGRCRLDAEMALRLSVAFGTSPELWLRLQEQYDLWEAHQRVRLESVRPLAPPAPAP